jgi:hypothetical protein
LLKNHITSIQKVDDVDESKRPVRRLGLTGDYEMMYIDDPKVSGFFREKFASYKRGW